MKSKAFTLVELLGVIVIIALIFILVFPSATKIISESKETIYQIQMNNILKATYDFSLKNTSYLPNKNEKKYITLGELKYEGLIDIDVKNPNTKDNFPDNLVISISYVNVGYKTDKDYEKVEGNYLYAVEIDKLNANTDILPTITLEDYDRNSDGNYIKPLNLNSNLGIIKYNAKSKDGEDLTEYVKKNITINDKAVESIDTSKSGIYKINYSVVDKDGYASLTTLNVIVADTEIPTITIPKNISISKETTNFDLMLGVDCEDNSGFCNIEVEGEIKFGKVGKYIIKYTVKDPSGNTTSKERIITIE